MIRFFLIIAYLVVICLPVSANPIPDQIRIMVPAFSGPDKIGFNASTFLNMQIFKTLRRRPTPNPDDLDFGHGEVLWSEAELSEQLHKQAEMLAKKTRFSAQMVLWGKAWHYGGGLIVQSYLSIPKYNDYRDYNHEVWEKYITLNNRTFHFQVDIPRRRLMFSPFFLTKEFIDKYSSPLSIRMYASPNSSAKEVGRIGLKVKALKVEKDWAKIRSGEIVGWVQLPTYTRQPVEPTHFAGGMIRIFRADWQGAYDMFEQVLKIPNISTSLKIDALLLQARALEELRKDGSSKLNEAFTLSPYSETVVKYLLMKMIGQISDAIKPISDQAKASLIGRINLLLGEKAYLFPPGDPFIIELREYITEIAYR